GEADVLVRTAVAGDVVRVQELIVVLEVLAGRRIEGNGIASDVVGVGNKLVVRISGDAIGSGIEDRDRVVRDGNQELGAGAHRMGDIDQCGRVAVDQGGSRAGGAESAAAAGGRHHTLGEAVRALDEIAVRVGGKQRNITDIGIGQVDAEDVARLRFDALPGRHPADEVVV